MTGNLLCLLDLLVNIRGNERWIFNLELQTKSYAMANMNDRVVYQIW